MKTISDIRTTLENVKARSAWDKGVKRSSGAGVETGMRSSA